MDDDDREKTDRDIWVETACEAMVRAASGESSLEDLARVAVDSVSGKITARARSRASLDIRAALRNLPEVPPVEVLRLLSGLGNFPEDCNEGKRLQEKHGSDAIPYKTEIELAAGFWVRLTRGLREDVGR